MSGEALRWFNKKEVNITNPSANREESENREIDERSTQKGNKESALPEEEIAIPAEIVALHDSTSVPEYPELEKYFNKFKNLTSAPFEGSVLHFVRDHRVGKKELYHYMEHTYLKRIGLIAFDPETDWAAYSLYSLVVPHQTALTIAEDLVRKARSLKTDTVSESDVSWQLLSEMTGYDMKNRGDLGNTIRAVIRRYPKFIDIFMSIMKLSK